jgi:predicted RNA-binding protein with PUA domain
MADRKELLSQLERIIEKGNQNYNTSLRKVLEIFRYEAQLGEWQLCPKCAGEGIVTEQTTSAFIATVTRTCPVCNGAKVLARPIINSNNV